MTSDFFKLPALSHNHFLTVETLKSSFYQGDLTGKFTRPLKTRYADLVYKCRDVDLGAFLKTNSKKEFNRGDGKVQASIDVTVDYGKNADDPGSMKGYGKIKITEGNFWQIPFLSSLGSALGTINLKALGKIDQLEAKTLEFKKQEVIISSKTPAKSNGTIVGLTITGKYNWYNQDLDFLVSSHVLKKVGLNIIFTPLTIFMKTRVSGNVAAPKWESENTRSFKNLIKSIFGR